MYTFAQPWLKVALIPQTQPRKPLSFQTQGMTMMVMTLDNIDWNVPIGRKQPFEPGATSTPAMLSQFL